MKSLTCVVVGDGSVFGVDIDELKKVWHLKDMIKERKMYNFPADQLTLYIAKRSGDWLSSADPDVQRLEDGETPHGITALMNDASKMNPKCRIRNVAFGFPDEADAGEDEIHILVDVPKYIKTGPHCDRTLRCIVCWYGTCC
ncbi:hypothetical protein PR001_g14543 [Phytophthora rubi]|uniref:Crinkler effector protein N-terminal domain-containing protein n=1 Tax=Phytophthora rubi TaxID=129364 RepID=A0A6A3LE19_9STRA|nr:hypothetical protein PR001_g14543 [Phytophthora rubi]